MTWRTHSLAGIGSLWLLEIVPGGVTPENAGLLTILAAFGALLPDLDAAESKIKSLQIGGIRPFLVPSTALHKTLGHRGLLHSLAGLVLVSLLSLPLAVWGDSRLASALLLGYASHLVMDACTPSGIPLLYPDKQRFHLLPAPFRITTGSLAEQLLFPFLVGAVVLLLLRVIETLILSGKAV